MCVDVDEYKIVNVYKPAPIRLQVSDLPVFPHPCLCAGDFNCQHVDWGYDANSAYGECLVGWANANNLVLLHNSKDAASFHSGRWNTNTNMDLAFVSIDSDSRLPDKQILEKFPRSQHRPSLITPPRLLVLYQASLYSDGTFARPSGATILLSQTNLPGLYHHLIHLLWIRHINVFVRPSALRRKSVSHVADEIIVYHVGMPSVKTSTNHSCNSLKGMNLAELLQLCLPGLTGNGGIDSLRLSKTSNFHTLAGQHGIR